MKVKDLIAKVSKAPQNEAYVALHRLAEDLLPDVFWGGENEEGTPARLKAYWLASHLCTDTRVGIIVYFFDDQAVCLGHQRARKSPEVLEWISESLATEVRDYLLSLLRLQKEPLKLPMLDLEEEYDSGYRVDYSGQLLTKEVLLGRALVRVVDQPRLNADGGYNFHTITIDDGCGKRDIDIRECLVPWCLEPHA